MRIRIGFDIAYWCAVPTPTILKLQIDEMRRADLLAPEQIEGVEALGLRSFTDSFGNRCLRGVSPAGVTNIHLSTVIADSGERDAYAPDAREVPVQDLPDETLRFLKPSRYCESDLLSNLAWSLFGGVTPGWSRVQAICDYAHNQIQFGYPFADVFRTAAGANAQRVGVCRDYAHLAVALCRAMNIPARYCNGYMGDIGVPPDPAPMDFNAWFEVYLSGQWWTFDARHNTPRIGRVAICHGLDAADCAMIQTFGQHTLNKFVVVTEEVIEAPAIGKVA